MDNETLGKSILNTVAYFDIFEYPLTAMEIYNWLYGNYGLKTNDYGLKDVQNALDDSQFLKDRLETRNGFYFLKGKSAHVRTRLNRYNIAQEKYKRAELIANIFSYFPFIQFIAVCNSLAYNNVREQSDIDMFIINNKLEDAGILLEDLFAARTDHDIDPRSGERAVKGPDDRRSQEDIAYITQRNDKDAADLCPIDMHIIVSIIFQPRPFKYYQCSQYQKRAGFSHRSGKTGGYGVEILGCSC